MPGSSIPLTRVQLGRDYPGALTRMSLGPDNYPGNALMVKLSNLEHAHLLNFQRSNSSRGIVLTLT